MKNPPRNDAALGYSGLPEEVRESAELLDTLADLGGAADGEGYVWIQAEGFDKYSFQSEVHIDCESRLPLCKAACCRLSFPLSQQDLEEGVVRWDPERPYLNARREDGYCHHLEAGPCRCSIYHQRPVPCRAFDCRHDPRIWRDFEKRIVNPALAQENWPRNGEGEQRNSGAPSVESVKEEGDQEY